MVLRISLDWMCLWPCLLSRMWGKLWLGMGCDCIYLAVHPCLRTTTRCMLLDVLAFELEYLVVLIHVATSYLVKQVVTYNKC